VTAVVGCGAKPTAAPPTVTVTAAPATVTVTQSATEVVTPEAPPPRATATTPALIPGPHSELADIDLSEGTQQNATSLGEEWTYNVPIESLVSFLQNQFADGRKYDARGATSWKGMPPCYVGGTAPPIGSQWADKGWRWSWADQSEHLDIFVFGTTSAILIVRDYVPEGWTGSNCLRS
jgi:hypothetical protein